MLLARLTLTEWGRKEPPYLGVRKLNWSKLGPDPIYIPSRPVLAMFSSHYLPCLISILSIYILTFLLLDLLSQEGTTVLSRHLASLNGSPIINYLARV